MIVVSNSGPLIALLKIGRLELLKQLFKKIFISKGTYDEVVIEGKTGYKDIKQSNWIEVKPIKDQQAVNILRIDLGKGESESVILAYELRADILLVDELIARNIAENLGLKISGTVGVLLKAKKSGLISEVKSELDRLKKKNVWLGNEVCKRALKIAGEL